MPYESTITFTLDTVCPWTYLAYLRLCKALSQYHSSRPNPNNLPVNFSLKFAPYQLYPAACREGQDKYSWYKKEKYGDSKEKMELYVKYMRALGKAEGVEFEFGGEGVIANTLGALRVLMWVQEHKGEEDARKALESLYRQYFEQCKHPSSRETLMETSKAAGLEEQEATSLVEDENEGLTDVKMAIREQVGNGVDSVPYVVFEGKRRDFTLVGAKEVGEYLKTMEQVAKEC